MTILITIAIYFALLLLISNLVGKGGNDAFFRGNRQSPWPVVAFGMIGASLSGVTFISVPGMVMTIDMTYLQMCIGFIFGYILVAFVLLHLYYKYNLTSIYSYLDVRFGRTCRKTGSSFFLLSKMTGAAARLYLVCLILQQYVFDALRVPFVLTVVGTLLLIWLYTHKSGIKAIVWTDSLQTLCLIVALILILLKASDMLGMSFGEAMTAVWNDPHSRIFEFSDWSSKQHFWKQFLSGIFIVIVMTGLDQDMMQKNLSCKNLRDSQKDLCSYGLLFAPVNFLFLSLGVMMMLLYAKTGTPLPAKGDSLLPDFIATGLMGQAVLVFFTIGIIASAFSSADSALTALTTSFCIDILGIEDSEEKMKNEEGRMKNEECRMKNENNTSNEQSKTHSSFGAKRQFFIHHSERSDNSSFGAKRQFFILHSEQSDNSSSFILHSSFSNPERTRKWVHVCMMVIFVLFILGFKALSNSSVIDTIYTIASYTYGPLLGLFAFGMTTHLKPRDKWIPFIAILSPIICYAIDSITLQVSGYKFGYEMLMFNGILTYIGLLLISKH